jgi:glyoxylase-like metal-dependent hydrolase (beta-lactamase superfamily II)
MNVVQQIHTPDHTVVVITEDDYVAALVFFGDTWTPDFDHPDAVVLLSVGEAQRLSTALVEAVERTRAAA